MAEMSNFQRSFVHLNHFINFLLVYFDSTIFMRDPQRGFLLKDIFLALGF